MFLKLAVMEMSPLFPENTYQQHNSCLTNSRVRGQPITKEMYHD